MIESEFRDWTRGQLRVLDERIKALAERKPEPAKPKVERRIHDDIVGLGEKLLEEAKAGRILGAAIIYVGDDYQTMTGYSADSGFFQLAGGAQFIGLELLEEFRKTTEAANDQPSGNAGADQAPAQG
jgi:hypothetical protein